MGGGVGSGVLCGCACVLIVQICTLSSSCELNEAWLGG